MAESIIDVVHRLNYQMGDVKAVDDLMAKFNKQIDQINALQSRIKNYGDEIRIASDPTVITRLSGEVEKLKGQVEKLTIDLGKQYAENKQLQTQLDSQIQKVKTLSDAKTRGAVKEKIETQEQIGLIRQLEAEEQRLLLARDASHDTREITAYNQQLFITRSRLLELRATTASAASGVTRLQFAGAQLLREAPAFTFSLQTGILALSNNIPILLDELRAARQAGQSTTSIFKQLGQAIYGITGIITIAVTVLTIYGREIAEFFTGGATYIDEFNKALEELDKTAAEKIANISVLSATLMSNASSTDEVGNAIQELQRQYPEFLSNISREKIGTEELNLALESQIALIRTRAEAEASRKAVSSLQDDLIGKERELNKLITEGRSNWQKFFDLFLSYGDGPIDALFGDMSDEEGRILQLMAEIEAAQIKVNDAIKEARNPIQANIDRLRDGVLASEKEINRIKEEGFRVSIKGEQQISQQYMAQLRLEETKIKLSEAKIKSLERELELVRLISLESEYSQAELASKRIEAALLRADDGSAEQRRLRIEKINADYEVEVEALKDKYTQQGKLRQDDLANNRNYQADMEILDAKRVKSIRDAQKSTGGRMNLLPFQLDKEIAELTRRGEELRLKDFIATDEIIARRIEQDRQAAQQEINIREEQAKEQGRLTQRTQEQFDRVRVLTNENFQQLLQNQTQEWHRKRLKDQADFNIRMLQMDISNGREQIENYAQQGNEAIRLRYIVNETQTRLEMEQAEERFRQDQENISRRLQGIEESLKKEVSENVETHKKLLEDQKFWEDQQEKNMRQHEESKLNIVKSGLQRMVDEVNKGYAARERAMQSFDDAQIGQIDESEADGLDALTLKYQSRLINLGKFRRAELELQYNSDTERIRAEAEIATRSVKLLEEELNEKVRLREKYIRDRADTAGIDAATSDADDVFGADIATTQAALGGARRRQADATRAQAVRGRAPSGFEKFMLGAEAFDYETAEERRQAAIERTIDLYQQVAAVAIDSARQIYQAQIAALDREMSYRESRMDYAIELSRRGNVELLNQERDRLDQLQKKREEIANKQLFLDSLLRASAAALTLAQSLQTVANAGATGDPYSTAARIAAAVAALAAGFAAVQSMGQSFQTGFAKGGYTGDGGTYEPAGIVHRREIVFSEENIRRLGGKDVVERIRTGDHHHNVLVASPVTEIRVGKLEKKMDSLIAVMSESKVEVHNSMDERGWNSMTKRVSRRDRNRFR